MPSLTKTESAYLYSVKEVLEIEANAILALKDQIGDEITRAIELILKCHHRVIVTGMGKSGIVGKKIAATLASTGTPSLFLHPAEGLHGDLGMVTEDDVIIAISNSGETDEILKTLPSIKRIGAKMIALVGNKNSTLSDKADITLCIGRAKEACPLGLAPTTSTTLTLALGDAIAIALLKARKFTSENFALFHPGGSLGRKLLLTVEDIIQESKKNPTAPVESDVKEVLFNMTTSGLGAISIIDTSSKLIGILTDGDIRRALTVGEDILNKSVIEFYNPKPITIKPNILAVEALKVMKDNRVNVLPVVDNSGIVVAMIHMHDLTKMGL
ncbi:KpsF/GutQ family sugar-phosphate isomerase [Metabacillus halosaccharovorans]|uniref:KpsF/GutQ family sugar-phosphate isomerase n=1 Tax=Metabacillus halosaccharovorans TaxID=930124 RepID=A0ABT3DBY2_9BACI|nr:KpsF/GutQ family sugar-phosphate isomerase [Metabacillus halosaccharovorans]MCV9884486.1 KpsF/GutQ family sugar-phosphate isomerase [Metabacillus halosaccharovorans]